MEGAFARCLRISGLFYKEEINYIAKVSKKHLNIKE
jgi:hypothetical protein